MATYYPIEFLPENPELGDPKTRNFFRNNLPIQPSSQNSVDEKSVDEKSVAEFGKQYNELINNQVLSFPSV